MAAPLFVVPLPPSPWSFLDLRASLSDEDMFFMLLSGALLLVYYAFARALLSRSFAASPLPAGMTAERWREREVRARSWLLTLPTSVFLIVVGAGVLAWTLPEMAANAGPDRWHLYKYAAALADAPGSWSRRMTLHFPVFCALDLFVGLADYRAQVTLLNGYVHHACYTGLCLYIASTRHSLMYSMFGVLELPTLLIAAGMIAPALRSDATVNVLFFLLRVCFHASIPLGMLWYGSAPLDPALFFSCSAALALHVHWFAMDMRKLLCAAPAKAARGNFSSGSSSSSSGREKALTTAKDGAVGGEGPAGEGSARSALVSPGGAKEGAGALSEGRPDGGRPQSGNGKQVSSRGTSSASGSGAAEDDTGAGGGVNAVSNDMDRKKRA